MSESNTQIFDLTDNISSVKHGFVFMTQGAEARLYSGTFLGKPAVLKERFSKKYRHPELDKILTVERTKTEVRGLYKCAEIDLKCPTVYFVDNITKCIIMEKLENSVMMKQFLEEVLDGSVESAKKLLPLAKKLGCNIAAMHRNNLVHGDLTTSNMLLKKEQTNNVLQGLDFDIYFIDFGLSRKNVVHEDKAVDLYVLERALISSHPGTEELFALIIKTYFEEVGKLGPTIQQKLNDVRLRGRKKSMIG